MADGGTGVHHEKGAGAVGAFAFAWLQAELPQGGGLLVAKQGMNRHASEGQTCLDHSEISTAWPEFGESLLG